MVCLSVLSFRVLGIQSDAVGGIWGKKRLLQPGFLKNVETDFIVRVN